MTHPKDTTMGDGPSYTEQAREMVRATGQRVRPYTDDELRAAVDEWVDHTLGMIGQTRHAATAAELTAGQREFLSERLWLQRAVELLQERDRIVTHAMYAALADLPAWQQSGAALDAARRRLRALDERGPVEPDTADQRPASPCGGCGTCYRCRRDAAWAGRS